MVGRQKRDKLDNVTPLPKAELPFVRGSARDKKTFVLVGVTESGRQHNDQGQPPPRRSPRRDNLITVYTVL